MRPTQRWISAPTARALRSSNPFAAALRRPLHTIRQAGCSMTEKGKYRIAGALAGTVNGLFGGGGGVPLVFLLRTWANVPDKTALATCVAVIFPFCLASLLVYALCGALPLREALPYLFGGLVGGWIGGKLFKNVPNTWLKRIFALFLLYGAARYLL